ncbi:MULTISPECIES: glucose 1-dehydrogenase [Rhodobacterales]|uniref:SDR family NAD(P)-dependent oxidoreductase n=1 Tax=Roseobacter sp. N2S TaxID=2663844 RepID=UPI002860799C|nr:MULTISPECIES: glucose 1-dehydrogenase [Rhodobacterales]MDR6264091.1 NAD(P)-dependent dehydrogenase (short-subunit alcohol dehydrogenase family) [Roseobacter sp. N2S]
MFDLSGRIAVVTGAGQGNGAAIARGLAQAGAHVALCDLNGDTAAQQAAAINAEGGKAMSAQLDVTDPDGAKAFASKIAKDWGAVSILVNNAGIIRRSPLDADTYDADWDATFAVNVNGMRHMVRAFVDQLCETRGSVINLGSIMSLQAASAMTAYAASKGAVAQYTKALSHELAPKGVRVNALLPGVIATPMSEVTRDNPDAIARFMAHTPMGRVGEPDELAGPTVFLASAAASYITGALLPVDGGYLTA